MTIKYPDMATDKQGNLVPENIVTLQIPLLVNVIDIAKNNDYSDKTTEEIHCEYLIILESLLDIMKSEHNFTDMDIYRLRHTSQQNLIESAQLKTQLMEERES